MARAAALDLARDGITVNCVCPSVTFTPLLEGRLATIPNGDEVLRSYAARHPLGRVLTSRDIASAIAYITSPLATRYHRRRHSGRFRHRRDLGRFQGPALGRRVSR